MYHRTKTKRTISIILAWMILFMQFGSMQLHAEERPLVDGSFQITGEVTFDEKTQPDDSTVVTDWKELIRPTLFDQTIVVKYSYTDSDKKKQIVTVPVQDSHDWEDFYYKFKDDRQGGGTYTILNVPKTVTVGENKYQIDGYEVSIQTNLPYYEMDSEYITELDFSEKTADEIRDITKHTQNLQLKVKTQDLVYKPETIPADDTTTEFVLNGIFKNPKTTATAASEKKVQIKANANGAATLNVPVGITYEVTQNAVAGYKMSEEYTTTIGDVSSVTKNKATGAINQDNVEIKTLATSRNSRVNFDINWEDNHNVQRPDVSEDWFTLQYEIAQTITNEETGETKTVWTTPSDLDDATLTKLGLDNKPVFETTETGAVYTGLTPVDPKGNSVRYTVVLKNNPEVKNANGDVVLKYTSEESRTSDGKQVFTLSEATNFNATIVWNDDNNREQIRPDDIKNQLSIYRKSDNDKKYKLVDKDFTITKTETNEWKISLDDLPRYELGEDFGNYEYDYVIVQGTIEDGKTVVQEKTNDKVKGDNPKKLEYKTYYATEMEATVMI